MSQDKAPLIRFNGFTDAWEQEKLGETLALLKDGTHGTHKDVGEGIYLLSAKNIKNGQINIDESDRKISEDEYKSIHKNFNLENGDVLLTIVGSIGEAAVLENPSKLTFQRSVAYLRPDRTLTSQFLYTTIMSAKFQRELKKRQVVSAQPGIYLGDLYIVPIELPCMEEQKKIGTFFKRLDDLITLHQRKHQLLINMKKSYLGKIFPKNDKDVPEIRFAPFTDAWEQRKLGEVTSEFKSGTSIKADNIFESGEYPVYGGNGIRGYTNIFNHDGDFALIGRQGALSGNMNFSTGKAYFTEHAVAVKANLNNDTIFLFHLMDNLKLGRWVTQSAQPGLAVGTLTEVKTFFPLNIKEQQKVGTFFKSLDDTITLHQSKLNQLKAVKNSLLQKMFV